MKPSIFIWVAGLTLNVVLLAWVARDARARDMANNVFWMVLVMFTGVFGFIAYLFSRPQGKLVRCAHCNNKRLQSSRECPGCGKP